MHRIVLIGILLWSHQTAARPLTLDEAQAEAARVAQSVLVAERQTEVARAEVQVAGILGNPNLTLLTSRFSGWLNATVSVPMPLFGQRGKRVEAAQADLAVSKLGVLLSQQEARQAAGTAWIELWAAQKQAELLRRALATTGRFLEMVTLRVEVGAAPRLDVLRAAAEQSAAAAAAAAADAEVAAAAARLLPWTDDAVEAPGDQLVEAMGEPPRSDVVLPGLTELYEQAMEQSLLRRDRAEIAAAASHVRAAQRSRWPIISGLVSVNFGGTFISGTDVAAGISLDLPILNLRGGAIAYAQAEARVADARLQLHVRQTLAEVRDAYYSVHAAAARARALQAEARPAMEEVAKLTEESYRQGRADLVRLLDAQRAAVEISRAEVEALRAFSKAVLHLERVVGRKL